MSIRRTHFAGTWYPTGNSLKKSIERYLKNATSHTIHHYTQGIICPHAGLVYSGPTMAYSWLPVRDNLARRNKQGQQIKRVFILGPSHQSYTTKCLLTGHSSWETPFGNVQVDTKTNKELMKKAPKIFNKMGSNTDSNEHSLELQLPFLTYILEASEIQIVPIMVGQLSSKSQKSVSQILQEYFLDPHNFFIISTDFCHWGSNFDYQKTIKGVSPIWKSIEKIDRLGMDAIETLQPNLFTKYLEKYENTICGSAPLLLFMRSVDKEKFSLKFVHYEQSNKVEDKNDMSVSYAAGIFQKNEEN
ncbi:protein memo1 [Anaeramoeba flamelloides]|uniref:Protein memo1 n=1 Tax=Anaeramoeba flamelloides TaxID=1746091 RepID=A0ABQ8XNS9_9EUKA|nr:protein memo1 [Anaeramoeba flamelloides]